jgi:hypothetical protein
MRRFVCASVGAINRTLGGGHPDRSLSAARPVHNIRRAMVVVALLRWTSFAQYERAFRELR